MKKNWLYKTKKLIVIQCLSLLILSFCSIGWCGKIVYPWNATTAIVKAGETFEVWFDKDDGQTVNSVELRGPYNKVKLSHKIVTGDWEYDRVSKNRYDTRIIVMVPAGAPADRYDLILKTSSNDEVSLSAVKVILNYKANYYVLHISDSHTKNGVDLSMKRISAIADMANIIDPELVFVTGDNVLWRGNRKSKNFQKQVNMFFEGRESSGIKGLHDFHAATFVAAGNHDYTEKLESKGCCHDSKSRFWNEYWGLQSYHFKYGKTRCMIINTGWERFKYSYQLKDHTSWLNSEGAGGNLRLAAYHNSRPATMGRFARTFNLGLSMVGHNHHLGDSNPYKLGNKLIQYYALSIREYCEFNLFKINDNKGTCTALGYKNTDTSSVGYGQPTGSCRVLENNSQKEEGDTSKWILNLTLNYENNNNGTFSKNTAALVNKFDFAIPNARVRFVMPKGTTYALSKGIIKQAFNGDSFHIVDLSVDLDTNSTTVVKIKPVKIKPNTTQTK